MAESYSSSLAERLMRRFTDPIGVVDVRPSVERYERATNWPRHHLAVVERSIARTRLDTQPEQGMPMALAAAGSLEPGGPLAQTPGGGDTSRRSPSSTPGSLMRAVRQAREAAAQAG